MQTHQHQHHHQHSGGDLAELLDLDAEVLHDYLAGVVGWVRSHTAGHPPRRIADIGAGTGAGTFELLAQFDGATVAAVDQSAEMLHRLAEKAAARGVAGRVRTVQADLDEAWPPAAGLGGPAGGSGGPAGGSGGPDGGLDLVWAANSLHHLADPDRSLGEIRAALRPGGLLAVVELESFPRFLPADLGVGEPGLEERCHAAMTRRRAVDMPHIGDDWGATLSRAGFEVRETRRFTIDLRPPLPPAAGRYALASLRRTREGLADDLAAADLATLDALLDEHGPHSVLRRTDLTVRAERNAWIAAKPT